MGTMITQFLLGLLLLLPLGQQIAPYEPVTVALDAQTPSHRYRIPSTAGESWSFSAVALSGDLDPILRLYDPAGGLLLANDNETRRSNTARLENWTAPAEGDYWLELAREGETSGTAQIIALQDANSLALSALPIPAPITLAADESVWAVPRIVPDKSPLTLRFGVDYPAGSSFTIGLETADYVLTAGWQLVINRQGLRLEQLAETGENLYLPRVLYAHSTPLPPGDYTLTLTADGLRLQSGTRVTAIGTADLSNAPANFQFLARNARALRLVAGATGATFSEVYASAPFYSESLPADGNALPPAAPNERLYSYDGAPLAVMEELRTLGYIDTDGGLIMSVPDAVIETSKLGFSNYPIDMARGYQDFVLHFGVVRREGSAETACGVSLRAADANTFTAVLSDGLGNAYVLPYVDGDLASQTLALKTPWADPNGRNSFLVVARDDDMQVFINGYRAGGLALAPQRGGLLVTIVVNQAMLSRCSYDKLWLWALE